MHYAMMMKLVLDCIVAISDIQSAAGVMVLHVVVIWEVAARGIFWFHTSHFSKLK